jgi:hypothetical protein
VELPCARVTSCCVSSRQDKCTKIIFIFINKQKEKKRKKREFFFQRVYKRRKLSVMDNGVYKLAIKSPTTTTSLESSRGIHLELQVGSPGSWFESFSHKNSGAITFITNLRDSSLASSSCLFSLISRCTLSSISRSWMAEWSVLAKRHTTDTRTFSSSRRSCSSFRRTL